MTNMNAEANRVKFKLSVLLAAYNEEQTVAKIIDRVLSKQIPHIDIELIIIESNSKDRTREIVRHYATHNRVKLVLQNQPRGKGNAIREGLQHIQGDFVLIQDADDEYDIDDYDCLLSPLVNGSCDFVLGARHGGRVWKMRQFHDQILISHIFNLGHWFYTFLVNRLIGLKLKDPFTMFKVFKSDCLQDLTFECDRFDFDFELLIKLVLKGYKPVEIPVNYRSRTFKEGKKIRFFRDPITWLVIILKFWWKKPYNRV